MLRFAGFELDQQRAELRGANGCTIKLRPKAFDLLQMLASNPRRLISKDELMTTVWSNLHVGEDNLFQCIREIRSALSDDDHQLVRTVFGRGYVFETEVSDLSDPIMSDGSIEQLTSIRLDSSAALEQKLSPKKSRFGSMLATRAAPLAAILVTLSILTVTVVALLLSPSATPLFIRVTVIPIVAADKDPITVQMASKASYGLIDGLSKIEALNIATPSSPSQFADFVVSGELAKTTGNWKLNARITDSATGTIKWTGSWLIERDGTNEQVQRSRLVAGLGHALALHFNMLSNTVGRSVDAFPSAGVKVALEQAKASIIFTTPERFNAAQGILEKALSEEPKSLELQVSLVALKALRISNGWDPLEGRDAFETDAGEVLRRAVLLKPNYIPVLLAYCQFLTTSNQFISSVLVCGKVLSHDPWNGTALNLLGISLAHLGRFEEALSSFRKANKFNTPKAMRWKWMIGAGWACLLLDRAEDAIPWLNQAITVNPSSGRAHLLLAAAYQQQGRVDKANEAMAKALLLRPGLTAQSVPLRSTSDTPILKASDQIMKLMVAAGLPET